MILVLLGTNPYPFFRLMDMLTLLAQRGEKLLVQSGNTPTREYAFDCRPFMDHATIVALIQEAEIVITQGGYGSIRDCLHAGKVPVAVPRLIQYQEAQDNQGELVAALAELELVVSCFPDDSLIEKLERARTAKRPQLPQSHIPELVCGQIREWLV